MLRKTKYVIKSIIGSYCEWPLCETEVSTQGVFKYVFDNRFKRLEDCKSLIFEHFKIRTLEKFEVD